MADAESGELLGIDMPVERDADRFANRLKGYVDRLGVEAVAKDDLSTYRPAVDKLGLDCQVCVVHARKNAARRLRMAKGWGERKSRLRMPFVEIRCKTLRGYKSVEGMMNGLWMARRVWGECGMDLGDLLAA